VTVLAVLRELRRRENRVALVPAEIPKLTALGLDVVIEAGAGQRAGFLDDAYAALERTVVVPTRSQALAGADMVVAVSAPTVDEAAELRQGLTMVSFLPPASNLDLIGQLRDREITAFSFDLVPRISRAQVMDALSSQASLAGYQAVLLAADRLGRAIPMMMTPAGTIPPARVLVMGAGVAGLQAIATARRLGGSVSAYDVRPEAAEEVRSLGAGFLDLALEAQVGEGGYAAEQSSDFLARQQALIADVVSGSDLVVTTAAIPGRPAPRLVSTATIDRMRAGSVIVDLAAGSGGNVELSVDGEEVDRGGVLVIGDSDLPSKVATTASSLYARNVINLMPLLVRDGEIRPNFDDDIVAAMCVTTAREVRHIHTREMLQGGEA
jgi:H+-translocating NAD(P) transhydrogenase subunit alpha